MHLALAKANNLPVIIHSRDASDDCLRILDKHKNGTLKGLCIVLAEQKETAKKCIELGLYISFAGPITFSNADKLREVAKSVPVERLLLETDSPFLSPQPKEANAMSLPIYLSLFLYWQISMDCQ